jgi:hypothetical protein
VTTFEHYGRVLTPETLHTAVWQAVQDRPQVPMALHPMAGDQWLTELMERLADHPLAEELEAALVSLLATVDPHGDELDLLAASLAACPGWVPAEALIEALHRSAGGNPSGRAALARALAAEVRASGGGHRDPIRALVADPVLRNALVGVVARFDFDAAVERLRAWFTGDASHDRTLFTWFARDLTRARLDQVRAEAAGPGWPPGSAEVIGEYVDRVGELPHVAGLPEAPPRP